MTQRREFPYEGVPIGWYQVAWTDDVAPGAAQPVEYFACDLVLCRSESGELRLFDAFCPHMGAHLGFGGRVEGDTLVCPFHGWRFDEHGRNCEIPYQDRPTRTQLRRWHVCEVGSLVLAWYHPDGGSPLWEPLELPEVLAGEFVARAVLRRTWPSIKVKPQFVVENLVDPAHQKYVHGAYDIPEIVSYGAAESVYRVSSALTFGKGKGKTWLTPDGVPRTASITTECWGIGLTVARFEIDSSIHIQSVTPIDDERSDSRATVLIPATELEDDAPPPRTIRRFEHDCMQFDADLPIWENLRYRVPQPLVGDERDRFRSIRSWCAEFYPAAGTLAGHPSDRAEAQA